MILIVESGSTKCNWVITGTGGIEFSFTTKGINPYFNDENFILEQLKGVSDLDKYAGEITEIHYFGAGSTHAALSQIIISALRKAFPNAKKINCESDLMAAALSTWDGQVAVVGILGTGANAALFDGKKLTYKKPALGYILGDEASGAYFGKQLLRAYFYGELPPSIRQSFDETYGLTKNVAFENIYRKPNANVYLASFMPFLIQHKDDSFIENLLRTGFSLFIKIHVLSFDRKYPLHLVGSVAHYGAAILKEEARKAGVSITQIRQRPIDGLVTYFAGEQE